MNRNEFDKLEAIEQIEYINNKLMEGNTVTNVCKSIGIGRSTIRDRFEKVSHKYNKSTNRYECIVEIIEATEGNSIERKTDTIIEDIPNIQESSLKVVGTDNEILTEIITNYDENLSKLNEMYSWYKLQSSNKVVETDKLKVDDFEGDIVVRSYKLYEPIQQEFADFCKVNNKYKVQDILSQALKEFLDKYK
ncbi:MAG: hypothetical protein ACRCX2_19310 [Paraclostridium sp.]